MEKRDAKKRRAAPEKKRPEKQKLDGGRRSGQERVVVEFDWWAWRPTEPIAAFGMGQAHARAGAAEGSYILSGR